MEDEIQILLAKRQVDLGFIKDILFEKYRMLTTISAISFAILALFISDLQALDLYPKSLVTLFLLLALFSIWAHFIELALAEKKFLRKIDGAKKDIDGEKSRMGKAWSYVPHIILVLFTFLVMISILYIWCIRL